MSDLTSILPLKPELVPWLEAQGVKASLFAAPSREPSLAEVQAALSELPALRVTFRASASGRTTAELSQEPGSACSELVLGESGAGIHFTHGNQSIITAVVGHLARRCGPFVVVHASGERPSVISASPTTIEVIGGWAEDLPPGVLA